MRFQSSLRRSPCAWTEIRKRLSNRRDVDTRVERPGAEVAQVYLELPASAGEPFNRLVAWQRVELAPGESKEIALTLDPLYLSIFDVEKNGWQIVPGEYKILVGGSSENTPLNSTFGVGVGHGGGIGSGN